MIKAAGILFVAGDSVLLLRRNGSGDHADTWCVPGGKLEDGESAEDGAIRETYEEVGIHIKESELQQWVRSLSSAGVDILAVEGQEPPQPEEVDFTTFMVRVSHQFTPKMSDEHDGWAWAPISNPPQPIHPGLQIALDRFKLDELGVAYAISEGRLTRPQRYENVWLFAIRITGTGVSYRHARKEFVWRDPSIYINDEFLARCNGLAVIWEHPAQSLLNDQEFSDRVIGSIMLPYIPADKPDEVWGIAKVYDAEAARAMRENQLSTSPAVNFADPAENDRVKLEDGKIMLIEGKPSLLDHIAICENGVWDKGGDPTGVESIDAMADSQHAITLGQAPTANLSLDMLRLTAAVAALSSRFSNRI